MTREQKMQRRNGKYTYDKKKAEAKWKEATAGKDAEWVKDHEYELRHNLYGANIGSGKHTDLAHTTSVMRKMENELKKAEELAKLTKKHK